VLALATVVTAQQPPAAPAAPAAGGRQGGAPAGPQNLKVLPKTWTGQQVRALMTAFNASLGVQCSYCHAPDPNGQPGPTGQIPLDYTLDTKGEKEAAREMIKMNMSLNDTLKAVGDASVVEKVSCFTCHQGAEVPAKAPAAGWGRGNFSLLPAGPTVPARGGGAPGGAPGGAGAPAPGGGAAPAGGRGN
jgi:hypothetical protein